MKYARDALWNYGSFATQAASGAAINFSILHFLNAEALGVFNQIYAVYAISGQLAVCGIHDSALKHAAEYQSNQGDESTNDQLLNTVCAAAVLCAICLGAVGALAFAAVSSIIGRAFDSSHLQVGLLYLAPGLFFFVINKTIIYMLNGLGRMQHFAVASGVRAVAIAILVGIVIGFYPSPEKFGLVFTLAEIAVFILLVAWKPLRFDFHYRMFRVWLVRHMRFGLKSLVHSLVSEAFIRVDILMLGIFMSDSDVGVYSFAAFFVEGIYQIPVVVRNLNNPILVRMLLKGYVGEIVSFARKTSLLSLGMTFLFAAAVSVIYPWLGFVFSPLVIDQSSVVLWVLLAGMVIYSIFVPFDFSFSAAGKPGIQSVFMLGNLIVNVLLNVLLIPQYGLLGACVSTVISFLFAGLMLNILGRFVLSLPRGFFFYNRSIMDAA